MFFGPSCSWLSIWDSGKRIRGLLQVISSLHSRFWVCFISSFRRTLKNPSALSVQVLRTATLPLRRESTAQQHAASSVWCVQGHVIESHNSTQLNVHISAELRDISLVFLSSCALSLQQLHCVWVLAQRFDWLSRSLHRQTVLQVAIKCTFYCFTSTAWCSQASHGAKLIYLPNNRDFFNWQKLDIFIYFLWCLTKYMKDPKDRSIWEKSWVTFSCSAQLRQNESP